MTAAHRLTSSTATERPAGILIVEDDAIIGRNIQQSLADLGYDPYAVAATSEEALAYATERCPDLVLLDIRIKGNLDGIETAALLRERLGVPVLYLTAHADRATIDRAKKTEPLGYLVKPVKQAELRSAVEIALYRDAVERRLRQVEHAERMASLGVMAAGVAHEVNNPLAVVVGNADIALESLDKATFMLAAANGDAGARAAIQDARSAVEYLRAAASRITRIVHELQVFARPSPAASESADVAEAIAWAVRSTSYELRHRARVVTELSPVPRAAIDETKLGQVLVNLLMNAAQAIAPGNVAGNQVSVRVRADATTVTIDVQDTGSGIPSEVLAHIFEPFYTTKPVGSGSGLGLSICHGILAASGGSIQVESKEGSGTLFRVVLPAASAGPSSAVAVKAPPSPERLGRLLVIDDEERLLQLFERAFKAHTVISTTSAREALERLARGEKYDIIFCDVMMPDMTGVAFYQELSRRSPEYARRVVFMTGGSLTAKIEDSLAALPNRRLSKPFDLRTVRGVVQELLATDEIRDGAEHGDTGVG